jgi:SPP1 family holin
MQARRCREKGQTMNAHTYNAPTISAGTIARTACLLLALTNQVLSALGKPVLPIESQTVEQLVTAGITTVAALVAWWKNNSFTPAALQADQTYDKLKAQGK